MKNLIASFFLLMSVLPLFSSSKADNEYTIMTCNIRITGLADDAPYPERVWENRRDYCVSTILQRNPDIVCVQEGIYDSYEYLKKKLKGYTAFGFEGPEMDPFTEGYHFIGKNIIYFRTKRFEVLGSGCYWLSKNPLIAGSMDWGTTRARHCNWMRLRDKKTGKQFRIIDVHLDHLSDSARREQIKIVMRECAQYADDFPQILCGDFNAGITSAPIRYVHAQPGWHEMYEDIHGPAEVGYTCHNWLGSQRKDKKGGIGHRIDFIFYRGPIKVKNCDLVTDHKGNMYPSDHYFVKADIEIN